MASIHSLPHPPSRACAGRERFHSALSPALEGRGSTFGPPDRERTPGAAETQAPAQPVGLDSRPASSSLIWLCGIREDQFTPGPKAAVQLRKGCRGHSLRSAWTGEKAPVGKSRGRKETGGGENEEGKRGPQGPRETDTRTKGPAPAPHPLHDRVHSAGPDASNLPRTVPEARPGGVLITQSCPTLLDPVHCSPPGSSIHGISQARILECVAIPFARGSSRPRDRTCISCIAGGFFTV